MTSINAYIYDKNLPSTGRELGPAIKRLEVSIDGPVGSCLFYLDNSSGISQVLEAGDSIADLGIDNHTLLRGYIDDVLPELENAPYIFSKYVTVKGRNFGRDLTRLMIKADFKDAKLGDVFNVGLLAAGSEIAADYASTGVGPVVGNIEANDMPLIDLFDDAVQKAKYGYTVNWDDKRLYSWPLENIPHTGILLKLLLNDPENNILLINPHEKNGSSICNSVKIKCNTIDDQLTEDYPYKTGENATVQDDHDFFAVGKSSIKVTSTSNNYPSVHFKVPLFPPSDNRQYLDYTHIGRETCTFFTAQNNTVGIGSHQIMSIAHTINVYIRDTDGRVLVWRCTEIKDKLVKREFILGADAPQMKEDDSSGAWIGLPGFNWKIVEIWFELWFGYSGVSFWVDGLTIPSVEAFVSVEDTESIRKYGRSMIAIYRPDLHTYADMLEVANNELAARKQPFEKLSLICKFNPSLLYAGLLVDVLAPDMYIGYRDAQNLLVPDRYRVVEIRHVAEPRVNLIQGHDCYTELMLIKHTGDQGVTHISAGRVRQASDSQYAANVSTERRLQTLEDQQNGSNGTSGGGGSGGSAWDGGDVSNTINVQGKFPFLNEMNNDVYRWLMTPMSQLQDYSAFINLHNIAEPGASVPNLMQDLNLYGVFVSNGTDSNPGLMVGHHLLYRGDFMGRGVMSSLEGVVVLHAGNIPAGVPGAGNKVCGWAPTANPMIWLAEGGNTNFARTLEIRIRTGNGWDFGHIEANNILSHGFIGTNYVSTLSGSGNINLNNNLVPITNGTLNLGAPTLRYDYVYTNHIQCSDLTAINGITTQDIYSPTNGQNLIHYNQSGNLITLNGNVKVTGNLDAPAANPFNQSLNTYNAVTFTDVTMTGSTTISGNIVCHQTLNVTHIRADNFPYDSIAVYSNIIPATPASGYNVSLGTRYNAFHEIYGNYIWSKTFDFAGCERSLSGQEWHQQIQNEQTALETLTHQVTKTVYHTTYNLEKGKEDEIICTCSKSVKEPCPEHLETYREKYTKNLNKQIEATAYLSLEHAAKLARLETQLSEANEKIKTIQQLLTEVKDA